MKFLEYARWKDSGWTPEGHLLSKNMEKYAQGPYYWHFTIIPKLGINPQAAKFQMPQPLGIYTYPGWFVGEKLTDAKSHKHALGMIGPFIERKYVIIITPKNPDRILNLGNEEDVEYYKNATGATMPQMTKM